MKRSPHIDFYASLADALTLLRALSAVWIVYLGWRYGRASISSVAVLIAAGWIADGLDGPLARRSRRPTWLGRYDFVVDVLLTWATFAYLTLAGYVPWPLALMYTLLAMLIVTYFQRKSVMIAFMRPIDLTTAVIALQSVPQIAALFSLWLVGLGIVHWRRVNTRLRAWLCDLYVTVRYGRHHPREQCDKWGDGK